MNTISKTIGNANTQEFKNIFSSNYCLPLITKPPRVTHSCASLIDNIYSNVPIYTNKCNSGILAANFDVSREEVRNIIHSLKNFSAGHDEFPTLLGNSA